MKLSPIRIEVTQEDLAKLCKAARRLLPALLLVAFTALSERDREPPSGADCMARMVAVGGVHFRVSGCVAKVGP